VVLDRLDTDLMVVLVDRQRPATTRGGEMEYSQEVVGGYLSLHND